MYTTTTKIIADYVGKEFGAAIRTLVLTQKNSFIKPRQLEPNSDDDSIS